MHGHNGIAERIHVQAPFSNPHIFNVCVIALPSFQQMEPPQYREWKSPNGLTTISFILDRLTNSMVTVDVAIASQIPFGEIEFLDSYSGDAYAVKAAAAAKAAAKAAAATAAKAAAAAAVAAKAKAATSAAPAAAPAAAPTTTPSATPAADTRPCPSHLLETIQRMLGAGAVVRPRVLRAQEDRRAMGVATGVPRFSPSTLTEILEGDLPSWLGEFLENVLFTTSAADVHTNWPTFGMFWPCFSKAALLKDIVQSFQLRFLEPKMKIFYAECTTAAGLGQ